MRQANDAALARSIDCFDAQYRIRGMRSQRSYPNESLIQFVAARYFALPLAERGRIRVLEVGCGTGANLWMLAKEGFEVHGLDSSETALLLARQHLAEKWGVEAALRQGSFIDLPYDDGHFDAVVDVVSLQHLALADCRRALAEVVRVLKPGGALFSYRLSDHSVMYACASNERIDAATLRDIDDAHMPLAGNGPTAFWSPALAHQAYAEVGLELLGCERIGRTRADGAFVEYLALTAGKPDLPDSCRSPD